VISASVTALADHLWQSTLFAVAVGCLTLLLRKNSARIRCWLWLSASAKFLLPFALLRGVGAHFPWPRGPLSIAGHKVAQIIQFGGAGPMALPRGTHMAGYGTVLLIAGGLVWVLGILIVAAHWHTRWRRVRQALRESTATRLAFVIPVRSSSSQLEPGVVGILRPVLLLPQGLERRLTPAELGAVLAHEHCHVAWNDNLTASVHMLVEALFWFHPLTWWLGTRMVDERERACDEQVLRDGHMPATYAEGILKVCEHYLGAGLACVAGIGGSSLRQRIEGIMNNRVIERLNVVRKLVIALAACMTIAVPLAIGVITSPQALAQDAAGATPDRMSINFRDADIGQVAAAVALAIHKTLIIDPRVHARVTIYSSAPMSPTEFYELFKATLQEHGFVAVPDGNAIRIVPDANGAQTSRPFLGPLRDWELRDEVWLAMPDPATRSRRP
jgi:bla regulator protein blaR1